MLDQVGRKAVVIRLLPASALRATVDDANAGKRIADFGATADESRWLPISRPRRVNYTALIGRKNPLSSTRS